MVSAVDPRAWKPKYAQVADDLRRRLKSGAYLPDASLPSEADLAHVYEVSPLTVRRALAILESERLIVREQGVRARVRPAQDRTMMRLLPGDVVEVRAASVEERRRLGLGEREPVAEIRHADGSSDVVAAYDVELVVDSGGDAAPAENS